MNHSRLALAIVALAATAPMTLPRQAGASGFGLFQHGGRATGQAGAFTARAADPTAVFYNPAGITGLTGFQMEGGLDFGIPDDSYASATAGKHSATHDINFPAQFYATWKSSRAGSPFAFGIGIDSPFYNTVNWNTALFPGRFLERRQEIQLYEAHPVVAYEMDEHWSLAVGARYLTGRIKEGNNVLFSEGAGASRIGREAEILRSATVSGWGFDASLQYRATAWGWGAVILSGAKASGGGSTSLTVRTDVLPALPPGHGDVPLSVIGAGPDQLRFELAPEARGGIWFAPYPELRVEIDGSFHAWSQTDNTHRFIPTAIAGDPARVRDRDWKDTISVRLGVEGDLGEALTIYGGVALEPSPVPTSTLDPGFSRGDATVYAVGASYNFPQISFDAGFSLHEHSARSSTGQELRNPGRQGRYTSTEQVFGVSARWRF